MGIASTFGYRHRRPNVVQRGFRAVGSSKPGAWVFAKDPGADGQGGEGAQRWPHERPCDPGRPPRALGHHHRPQERPGRATPLIAVPVGDDGLALLGTNFGQSNTPAWVFNLEADPAASVKYRHQACPATARSATDAERDEVWRRSTGIYGGYDKYQERITGRTIRIFVLDPA